MLILIECFLLTLFDLLLSIGFLEIHVLVTLQSKCYQYWGQVRLVLASKHTRWGGEEIMLEKKKNNDLQVAHPHSGSLSTWFLVELEFENVGFWGEGKTGVPGEKPLGAKERTNNKLNPHMVSTPGFEPGPHSWEASALTTAPPLLPEDRLLFSLFQTVI